MRLLISGSWVRAPRWAYIIFRSSPAVMNTVVLNWRAYDFALCLNVNSVTNERFAVIQCTSSDDLEELPTPILPQDRGVISCPSGEVLADGTTFTLTECSLTGEWSHIAVENTCEGSGLAL